jgi:uncharacterized protein involved in exopolysaccharide biosynthesis
MTTVELFRVFLRHRKKMALFFCVAVALIVTVVIAIPRRYPSQAKMLLRIGRETVALDPTATLGQVINVSQSGQSEINTLLEVLKSRDLAEKVVAEIGTDVILEADATSRPVFVSAASDWLADAKKFVGELVRSGETQSCGRLPDE